MTPITRSLDSVSDPQRLPDRILSRPCAPRQCFIYQRARRPRPHLPVREGPPSDDAHAERPEITGIDRVRHCSIGTSTDGDRPIAEAEEIIASDGWNQTAGRRML
jgi:hypothetical protein